jgi:hypothetical protein
MCIVIYYQILMSVRYGDRQIRHCTRTCILVMAGHATIEKVIMNVNANLEEEVMVKVTGAASPYCPRMP